MAPALAQTSHSWTALPPVSQASLLFCCFSHPIPAQIPPDVSLFLLWQLGVTKTTCQAHLLPGLLPFCVHCLTDTNWGALKQNRTKASVQACSSGRTLCSVESVSAPSRVVATLLRCGSWALTSPHTPHVASIALFNLKFKWPCVDSVCLTELG